MNKYICILIFIFPTLTQADCIAAPKALVDLHVKSCRVVQVKSLDEKDSVVDNFVLLKARIKEAFKFETYTPLSSTKEDGVFSEGNELEILMSKIAGDDCKTIKFYQDKFETYKTILTSSCCDTGQHGSLSCQFQGVWGNTIPEPYSYLDKMVTLNNNYDWVEENHNKKVKKDTTK